VRYLIICIVGAVAEAVFLGNAGPNIKYQQLAKYGVETTAQWFSQTALVTTHSTIDLMNLYIDLYSPQVAPKNPWLPMPVG
jgi:hypothetical protein